MPNFSNYEDQLKAKIRLYPLIGVAVGVVIGFFAHMLLF